MIPRNRLYKKQEPSRDAKCIYIYCEGMKREYDYFSYFQHLSSRINVVIYKLNPSDNNSPLGLFNIAKNELLKSDDDCSPKYDFQDDDEVWFIIDKDRWTSIDDLKGKIQRYNNWKIAQSNPCFEVWLYFHLHKDIPAIKNINECKNWKQYLNDMIPGGFNSRKHSVYIKDAIENTKSIYNEDNVGPQIGCTQVYKPAEIIYSFVKNEIKQAIKLLENN